MMNANRASFNFMLTLSALVFQWGENQLSVSFLWLLLDHLWHMQWYDNRHIMTDGFVMVFMQFQSAIDDEVLA